MEKRWILKEADAGLVSLLSRKLQLTPLIARLLVNRGSLGRYFLNSGLRARIHIFDGVGVLGSQIIKLTEEKTRLDGQLSNTNFVERAPAEKVQELRDRQVELDNQIETLKCNLEALE